MKPSVQQREEMRTSGVFADSSLSTLDMWILSRQAGVHELVTHHLDSYDFMRAGRLLEQYIDEISTWYLRRSRKRNDQAFFAVLYDILLNLVTMMAPLVPFISDLIFRNLRHEEMGESVHLEYWSTGFAGKNQQLESDMSIVRDAVELGLAVRATEKQKVRQPLAKAFIKTEANLSSDLLAILQEELNVESVEVVTSIDEGYPQKATEALTAALDTNLTEELLQAGLARDLQRNLQQLRKQLGLQPGQQATLVVGESQRSVVEPLLQAFPEILAESFLIIDPEKSWNAQGKEEMTFNEQTLFVDLVV
jgi:isoleucyl-tRNA synthetase